jgi:mRNA interferase MazF
MTRGDVFRIRLPRRQGHAQRGRRYGVVVQTGELMGLPTVVIAPTSLAALPASFRPVVEIAGSKTRVMVEQLRALDVGLLGEQAGRLDADEQAAVDDALRLVLGLT